MRGDGRSSHESAAAHGCDDGVEIWDFVQQLQRRGSRAGDDPGIVEWRNHRRAPLGGDFARDFFAMGTLPFVEHDLRSVFARRVELDLRAHPRA